ncbi:MAG TPA: hypothetical protein VHY31_13920 [Streptosporangiaceae bacterium]|nr:hypothetical protein [Streptosporangiaceae bacterium]
MFDELFAALVCDRDRAIVALYVSTGARPSELLGMRQAGIDHSGQAGRGNPERDQGGAVAARLP